MRLNENEVDRKPNKHFQKTNDGKQILRDMMSRYIPKDIIKAKKQGFSSPDASWFKGESLDFVKSVIFDQKSRMYNFMDRNSVEQLVQEHLDGRENRRLLIWSLINFEQTLKDTF